MDLPSSLLRMLESSCAHDQLKNWSIYEEKDGVYTFKIRFQPNVSRHIEDLKPDNSSRTNTFKRKNARQMSRDNARNKSWQERRITRSQTAKQSSEDNTTRADSCSAPVLGTVINFDTPIETERHSDFQFNPDSPEFTPPSYLNLTNRDIVEISDVDLSSNSDDESDVLPSGFCHPNCIYGASDDKGLHFKIYKCVKCEDFDICEQCLSEGAHHRHKRHIKLKDYIH